MIRERSADVLKRGAVLIDENDPGDAARLLFYIEHTIQDGTILPGGGSASFPGVSILWSGIRRAQPLARAMRRIWITAPLPPKNGRPFLPGPPGKAGFAVTWNSRPLAMPLPISFPNICRKSAPAAKPDRKNGKSVKERLTAEIQYWDYRAAELKLKENAGKRNSRLNSQQAERRAEELAARLKTRLEELEERQMLLVAEVRSLKKLFSDVEAVYSNLQTLLLRLKNAHSAGAGAQQPAHTDAMRRTHGKVQAHCNERHQGHAENAG